MLHNDSVKINDYKETDWGRINKAMERSTTGKAIVMPAGKVDWIDLHKRFEIKGGAGELGRIGNRLLKGVSKVLYVPVIVTKWVEMPDEEGEPELVEVVEIADQEGFILSRDEFLSVLEDVGLLREKTSTHGVRNITIQTFWNRSKNAPHGKKYYALLDELYERCEMTLEDYIEMRNGEA